MSRGKLSIQIGEKHNKLTVLEILEPRVTGNGGKHRFCRCECECGNIVEVRATFVTTGETKSCGCIAPFRIRPKEGGRFVSIRSPEEKREAAAVNVWKRHYRECPFDHFILLSRQPCHYCKCAPAGMAPANFTYNGLDRKDPTKDHSPDNVVPCCGTCNMAKGSMRYDEFIQWIRRVYEALSL